MKATLARAGCVESGAVAREARHRCWGCTSAEPEPALSEAERVFLSVVPNCSKQALMPILRGHILEQSDVYTDGWKAYDGLLTSGYQHHRIHHHQNEFARGKNHVNGIESFWSFARAFSI